MGKIGRDKPRKLLLVFKAWFFTYTFKYHFLILFTCKIDTKIELPSWCSITPLRVVRDTQLHNKYQMVDGKKFTHWNCSRSLTPQSLSAVKTWKQIGKYPTGFIHYTTTPCSYLEKVSTSRNLSAFMWNKLLKAMLKKNLKIKSMKREEISSVKIYVCRATHLRGICWNSGIMKVDYIPPTLLRVSKYICS